MDPLANNYNPLANINQSCTFDVTGCTTPGQSNYNPNAITDDGSCIPHSFGCLDPVACNYDSNATLMAPWLCVYIDGCTDATACNYDPAALCDDGSCTGLLGCTNALAGNYSPLATCDDGSCVVACPSLGTVYQGGIVFYTDTSGGGCSGLAVSEADVSNGAPWGCHNQIIPNNSVWTTPPNTAIGMGQANTTNIVDNCADLGTAARLADEYSVIDADGVVRDDWYLPSMDELELMNISPVGYFDNTNGPNGLNQANYSQFKYWSSSQWSSHDASIYNLYQVASMQGNFPANTNKITSRSVRAIRSFTVA